MARHTLAETWLSANDPNRRQRDGHKVRVKEERRFPLFYNKLDEQAFSQLRWHESPKFVKAGRKHYTGPEFIEAFKDRDQRHCLLMPGMIEGFPATVSIDGVPMPAARYMCTLANGKPESPDLVARHLCGNGHWSCVNPKHLAWGTVEENAQDRVLHREVAQYMPDLTEDEIERIKADNRHPNVIAIDCGIHTSVVAYLKLGPIRANL
jgi:hypothetical protein